MGTISRSKLIKRIFTGVWWALVGLLALCIVSILGAKMKGKVPQIFGYSVLQIVSGSMEPEIPVGSYILVKERDPQQIETGDIICFYSSDPQIYGVPNTHRVTGRVEGENGLEFTTKGDVNLIDDKTNASADRVIGVYVGKLNGMTKLSNLLDGNGVIVLLVASQLAICAFVVGGLFLKKNTQDGQDKKE